MISENITRRRGRGVTWMERGFGEGTGFLVRIESGIQAIE